MLGGDSTREPETAAGESTTSETDRNWRSATRRAVLGGLCVGGVGVVGATHLREVADRVAPLSGLAWDTTGELPDRLESPYGPATLSRDRYGVPHVEADGEEAAYYALGHAHAVDRLLQMDLQRRSARGTLAEVGGPSAVEDDVRSRKLDFPAAAAASHRALEDTRTEAVLEAYADGVTAVVDREAYGIEFGLVGYEPDGWTVRDSFLVMTGLTWSLAGGFSSLYASIRRQAFDEERYRQLFPDQYDHDVPIVRDASVETDRATATAAEAAVDPALGDWVAQFEPPDFRGSNAWTIAGEHTKSGSPILASDPHLSLQVPPAVYEQSVAVGATTIRGVTVPGVPFVAIGENDDCAWGFTNAGGVDVVDCYTYEVDGERYRYDDEWREFERRTERIQVTLGEDRDVRVRKTVHGAFLDPDLPDDDRHVGVAWTGMGPTRELLALHEMNVAEDADELVHAARTMDGLPLNLHCVDRSGTTRYQLIGKVPIRRVDGTVVASDRVFDGSAGHAEWRGFEPYGDATWTGFVPFEDLPSTRNRPYLASANQRIVDDHEYPIETANAPGFRATRIYEQLDEAVAAGESLDLEFCAQLQLDVLDVRARLLVPHVLEARDRMPAAADPYLDDLADWDYRMDRDSRGALVFDLLLDHFEELTWSPVFDQRWLSRRYWPSQRVLLTLPTDSEFFDGDRAEVFVEAVERTVEELEEADWETYGDRNQTDLDHLLGRYEPGLNYERRPTDGALRTVRTFTTSGSLGASYRLLTAMGGESRSVIAGGNVGRPTSDHYQDQLGMWADGEYKDPTGAPDEAPDVTFEREDE